MANIKSEQKDILTNEKNRLRNKSYKSQVRTAMKKVRVDVEKKVERATLDADFQHALFVWEFKSLTPAIVKRDRCGNFIIPSSSLLLRLSNSICSHL